MVGMFGMQTNNYEYHKCGFSFGILKNILEDLGMKDVKRVRDWRGIIPWSDLHVIARKSESHTSKSRLST